jgi:hypothetical protein
LAASGFTVKHAFSSPSLDNLLDLIFAISASIPTGSNFVLVLDEMQFLYQGLTDGLTTRARARARFTDQRISLVCR